MTAVETLESRLNSIVRDEASVPETAKLNFPVVQKEYLLDGKILEWNGEWLTARSPACFKTETGSSRKEVGKTPKMGEADALKALNAAVAAFACGRGEWPTMGVAGRIACMEKFAAMMKAAREEVVRLLCWEIGKTRADSEKEFDRTVEYILATVEALKDLDRASSRPSIAEGILAQIRRSPLGVVLCMGPFNYPLNETFTTLIPALIMGNTVVFKPAKLGVLLFGPLLKAFAECFPAGVVNTVYGEGSTVVGPLMKSGRVDVLAFIGSCRVADTLKQQHPHPHRLKSVLGLGAKNPAVILPDADLDLTVKEAVLGSLSFNGQRCTALKIFFVHKSIADDFLTRFSDAITALKPGLPWDEGVNLTPLPEKDKPAFFTELVKDALAKGAKIVNPMGGEVRETYFHPALLYPVSPECRVYQEEQFGPVIPVVPYESIEEVVAYITDSDYGQQLSVFGTAPETLGPLIDPLVNQVCRVNINSQCQRGPDQFPFTGRKDSAEGTLSVSDALRVFSIRTLVASKLTPQNRELITRIWNENRSEFLSTDFIL